MEERGELLFMKHFHDPQQVLYLLQQGKKADAEDYIMEHSVLFNKKDV